MVRLHRAPAAPAMSPSPHPAAAPTARLHPGAPEHPRPARPPRPERMELIEAAMDGDLAAVRAALAGGAAADCVKTGGALHVNM